MKTFGTYATVQIILACGNQYIQSENLKIGLLQRYFKKTSSNFSKLLHIDLELPLTQHAWFCAALNAAVMWQRLTCIIAVESEVLG